MKFPFFKGQKPESEATMSVFVPTRTPTPNPKIPVPAPAPAAVSIPLAKDITIPVRLNTILAQLPRNLFTTADKVQLSQLVLDVPSGMVAGQLPTGKVLLTVAEISALLPAHLINATVLDGAQQHTVALPLADVIAAIPPEALAIQHENEILLDEAELAEMPGIFEPPPAKEPSAPVAVPAPPERVVPMAATRIRPVDVPAGETQPMKPLAAPPSPAANIPADVQLPEHIHVTIRGLVAGIPDNFFICAKPDLGQHADLGATVDLALEPLLPQLQSARVTLPFAQIIHLIPPAVLVSPTPPIAGINVNLPLNEIIPQLPARLFTAQLSGTEPEDLKAVETEIPTPFQERAPRVTVETPPVPVPAPAEEPVEEEITAEELEEEAVAIFAEKKPTPAAGPVEPVAPLAPVMPTIVPPPPPAVAAPPAVPVPEPLPATVEEEVVPSETVAETVHGGVIDEKKFLVDLNRCSVEDLIGIPGVGRTLAERIIEFRNNRGRFTSVDELRLIPGIGRKTYRALTGVEPRSLNRLLGVAEDRELTLQEIVKLTSALPGIDGCMLAMADGLFLTGQLPAQVDQDAVSVFAPQLFRRMGRYVKELKVGHVRRFTIFTDERPISVFKSGDVYLVILHDTRHFSKRLLRQCERISQEIARLCRQRTVV